MVAVAMFATSAMASKARVAALQNATHLSDKTDVLAKPHTATLNGNWAIFEMGATASTANSGTAGTVSGNAPTQATQALGGFVKQHGDAAFGAYLGNNQPWVNQLRPTGQLTDENPINFFYGAKAGDLNWGAGLGYSNSDKKTGGKQAATTLIASVASGDMWDANLTFGLANTSSDGVVGAGETKFTGATAYNLNGTYNLDGNNAVELILFNNGGKSETGSTTNYNRTFTQNTVKYVNHSKVDGGEFYYGVGYQMTTDKETQTTTGNGKIETTSMPFTIGVEADANSWLALRASVTQNVLLGSTKSTTGQAGVSTDETRTLANNTTVAAGAGIKWGKVDLDAALQGQNTGTINGSSLLANAGLTYKF